MAREIDRKKFVELAEKRVSKTLKDIKLIGNLSNKSNYSYTDKDVRKIYGALKKALDDMKVRFDSNGVNEEEAFKL
jgi:hypothetical protein